ncbi:MAG TPA: hypothetical protein VE871_18440 [Longimicrobium sp.]|nr:hypothetical protein [Longimicrobium sp.]
MDNEAIPLACVAGAIPADERAGHFALARRLFGEAAEERQAWREGYAFRFAPDAFADVARFVANERKCCPFLDIEIAAESAGPVWLRLTGPVGTRAFLEAELGIPAG